MKIRSICCLGAGYVGGPTMAMIAAKCPSLAQRRRAHEVLKTARAELAAIEAKMASMVALSDAEQQRYDTLDAVGLEEKHTWLAKQMELMVIRW